MLTPSWINDDSPIEDTFGDGERAVQWLRRLRHPKNAARGHPFQLDRPQERIIRRLYGPRHPDGTRVVRRLTLLLPRGGRKTSLCAAITLLHLIGPERQPGGLIVSAASAHEQALELFNEAALIVQGDGRLRQHLKVLDYTSTINFPDERSRYKAVASDGKVQHGKTPNVVIADELHAWEGKSGQKQWEALDSALVKVPNTLMIVASTAGRGQENLAWKTVEYAIKVQKGEIIDPATLPVIFMAEEGDDWQDEALWHAVNPGMAYGYPDLASYRDKAQKAINSPSDRDSFLQYNLNRWLDYSASPFVEMSVYDENQGEVDLDALAARGDPCWLGVDMSISRDLTAIVAAWRDADDGFIVHPWFFCPGDNVKGRQTLDGVSYASWADQGHIIPTPGPVIDHRRVADEIRAICRRYNVQEVAFDPNRANFIMSDLLEDGIPVVSFPQNWDTIGSATDILHRAVSSRRFRHNGSPVLRWNFGNIAVVRDRNDNIGMHKGKSRDRIDGAVAAAMACARASAGDRRSVYEAENFDVADWL